MIKSTLSLAIIASALLLAESATAADSVVLTEAQSDVVKCGKVYRDPDTGDKMQDCGQVTTGSYSVTIKLSAATMASSGILFTALTPDTQVGVTISSFSYSGQISDDPKSKFTKKAVTASWADTHELCSKYDLDGNCTKTKIITDGTYKLSAAVNSITITLSGKLTNDSDGGHGQQMLINSCQSSTNNTGLAKTNITEDASITVGEAVITLPLKITCTVKNTTKTAGLYGDSYYLSNVAVKGKL